MAKRYIFYYYKGKYGTLYADQAIGIKKYGHSENVLQG